MVRCTIIWRHAFCNGDSSSCSSSFLSLILCGAVVRFEEKSASKKCQFRQTPRTRIRKRQTVVGWCILCKRSGSFKRLVSLFIVLPRSFKRIGIHGTVQPFATGRLLPLIVLVSVAGSSLTLIKLLRVTYIAKLCRKSVHLSMRIQKKPGMSMDRSPSNHARNKN